MSEQLSFDRKKGFVALPVEILDIDLSPGAFRTLVELCRMANAEGFCWPSLDQLSTRTGRSRSTISGYLKELRSAGLIETREQQTANGYNYRLKYQVTFWQAWRASLRGKTDVNSERSVQQTERVKDSKNHNHKNHPRSDIDTDLDHLLRKWATCFRGTPYPAARSAPSSELLGTTDQELASHRKPPDEISADIICTLAGLWSDLSISATRKDIEAQAKQLIKAGYTIEETTEVVARIRRNWPAHWRKFPTLQQFEKLLKTTGIAARAQKMSLLKSYRKRWSLAEKHLHSAPPSCSLTQSFAPAAQAADTQKYPWI